MDGAPAVGHVEGVNRRAARPDLYAYLDYRQWLRDEYAARKAERRGFSFRSFSRRAGLVAPNHLKRVMDGERSLSEASALRYAQALDLDEEQTAYFLDLVDFAQAGTDEVRNAAYTRLQGSRGYRRAHRLDAAHAAYTARWYLPAIRELVRVEGFRADPAWIGAHLVPPLPSAEAARAVDTLLDLGLLRRTPDGGLAQEEAVVTTGPETRGLHIRNFHRAMMERAGASMELTAAAERDLSALTFVASESVAAEVKRRVQAFRKELVAFLTEQPGGTKVVQLNVQLFPLSRTETDPCEP